MKHIVSVPFIPPPMPWANLPNSSVADLFHISLNRRCFNSWWYSRSWPVSWSRTEWAALRLWQATWSAIDSFGIELVGGGWRCCACTHTAMESSKNLGGLRMGLVCGWMLCSEGNATINRGGGTLSVGGVTLKIVISHGIGGINIPAKWRNSLKASHWSKRWHELVTWSHSHSNRLMALT